jgi:hypothetical protein
MKISSTSYAISVSKASYPWQYKIVPRQLVAYDNASQESGPQPLVGMQDSARTQVCLRNQVPVTHVFPDMMNILPRLHELLKLWCQPGLKINMPGACLCSSELYGTLLNPCLPFFSNGTTPAFWAVCGRPGWMPIFYFSYQQLSRVRSCFSAVSGSGWISFRSGDPMFWAASRPS